jgi:hypothetical protein
MRRLLMALPLALAACGGTDPTETPDATSVPDPDGAIAAPDAETPAPDAAEPAPDADDGLPLPGFGAITGMCGILAEAELTGTTPLWFDGDIDFAEPYDDPEDRDQLTPGGVEIILDGNAGGSSLYSEVFAYEILQRCELATLLKTETEILYDVEGKKADLLVEIDGHKIGVSVTRAVTFPFGSPYTLEAATTLIDRKLDDILLARDAANVADRWEKSMLATLAYDLQHAEVFMDAWNGLDAETRADSIVIVFVTSGDDLFIYTDQ